MKTVTPVVNVLRLPNTLHTRTDLMRRLQSKLSLEQPDDSNHTAVFSPAIETENTKDDSDTSEEIPTTR